MTDTSANLVAGAAAGFVSSLVVAPLDVVKTRLQTPLPPLGLTQASASASASAFSMKPVNPVKYRGISDAFHRIWAEEGIRGMYRGLGPLMIGYLPTWAIYFGIYEHLKSSLISNSSSRPEWVAHTVSALSAGMVTATLTNPIWVVKTRLITQFYHQKYHYKNTFDAFRQIVRLEGVVALYKGLGLSLLGTMHVAIQFPIYETIKSRARNLFVATTASSSCNNNLATTFTATTACSSCYNNKSNSSSSRNSNLSSCSNNNLPENSRSSRNNNSGNLAQLGPVLIASTTSKMIASSVTYPHEVLRTRIQNLNNQVPERHAVVSVLKDLIRNEGFRALYSGLTANLLRVVPASSITLVTFEYVRSLF